MKKSNNMFFNNLFSKGICLLTVYLSENKNTINNYDSSYKIVDNNTIRIKLSNFYEKLCFIVKLDNNTVILCNMYNQPLKKL